jgi:hypothetical protein
MTVLARTLQSILDQVAPEDLVHKRDLGFGDRVVITTRNSVYTLSALGDGRFVVSGGWFDKKCQSPTLVTVNGCTYGGSLIRHDVVAGRGLFLEFGNTVSTTRIQDVQVHRRSETDPISAEHLPC